MKDTLRAAKEVGTHMFNQCSTLTLTPTLIHMSNPSALTLTACLEPFNQARAAARAAKAAGN